MNAPRRLSSPLLRSGPRDRGPITHAVPARHLAGTSRVCSAGQRRGGPG